jgi:hypothetical protein
MQDFSVKANIIARHALDLEAIVEALTDHVTI